MSLSFSADTISFSYVPANSASDFYADRSLARESRSRIHPAVSASYAQLLTFAVPNKTNSGSESLSRFRLLYKTYNSLNLLWDSQ